MCSSLQDNNLANREIAPQPGAISVRYSKRRTHLVGEYRACVNCHGTFPLREFPTNGTHADGSPQYRPRCKPCWREFKRRGGNGGSRKGPASHCVGCNVELTEQNRQYGDSDRTKPLNRCKPCWGRYHTEWRRGRLKSERAQRSARNRSLRFNYGITLEEYEHMSQAQGSVCAICGLPERLNDSRSGKTRILAVDHDHTTGAIRGLLCSHCNRSLGLLGDDVEVLRNMLSYLDKPRK